ncbi:MAG: PD-(D/E)XK nuclease family protein, partial [Sinobacteraceae bacterium]|nr:PD-(D/E)XK nuclease family protein [Nevskiaceae bacterium]
RAATAWPWIAAADAVFAIDAQDTDIDRISCLLLATPLWEGPSRIAAAALDYQLRRAGRSRISLNALVAKADPIIKPRLQRLMESIRAETRRAAPSAWAQAMTARLAALGWPGQSALPSQAYQCVQELERRLARLGSMDSIVGTTGIGAARTWLGEILRAGFEPRVEHAQPVAIVSPDAAVGLPCELLVVCDASTDAFPGRTQQTPFLAPDVQRKAGIPEADPALHLEQVRQTLHGMTANAAQVRIFVPAVDDTGAELQPSPLFDGEWLDAEPTKPVSLAQRLAAQPAATILPEQDPVPAVSAQEHIHGDTRLFEKWAEAPFFAFCTHRLGLEALPQPARGLDARDQGTIIHDALRRVWEQLRTRDRLLALNPTELDALLREALKPTFQRKLKDYEFGPALIQMESARMHDLLRQWMAHEKTRFDPFEVIACEQPLNAELAGLPLSLVIDRIDRIDTATGPRWLVLDYKTGRQADPKGWEADVLRSPQLPLYATLAAHADLGFEGVDGIGFAHLKDGHPAFSAATDWCKKLREAPAQPKRDWDERLTAWTAALENAARGFLAGDASFDASTLPQRSLNAWLLPLTGASEDDDAEGEVA